MASASHVDLTRIRSEHHGQPNPFLRALQATVQAGAEDPPPPRIFTDAEQRVDAAWDALGETAEELQHRVEVALPAIVLQPVPSATSALFDGTRRWLREATGSQGRLERPTEQSLGL